MVASIEGMRAHLELAFDAEREAGHARSLNAISKLRISHLFVHETCLQVGAASPSRAVAQHVRSAVVHAASHVVAFENHTMPVHQVSGDGWGINIGF